MALDLSCLNISRPLPPVPMIADGPTTLIHPSYTPNGNGIAQMISSSITRSTFSINDVESLLKTLFDRTVQSWDVSSITKMKPIPSVIIYTSVALGLVLVLSLIFCITSCLNLSKRRSHQTRKRQKCPTTHVCAVLLSIVYLLVLGDMIYVAYRVNKTKMSLDDTIKELNQDVYPKEISAHLQRLIQQLEKLDQYCVQPDSILINASKSMLVKAFDRILDEKYIVKDLIESTNTLDRHVQQLDDLVNQQTTLPQSAIDIFRQIQFNYEEMVKYLKDPLREVCDYADGTQTDIDKKLLEALEVVHRQLRKLIETINRDLLSHITPWQNTMLMDKDLEENVRYYLALAGILLLVLVILVGLVPIGFFLIIILSRLCGSGKGATTTIHRHRNHSHEMRLSVLDVNGSSSSDLSYLDEDADYRSANQGKSRHHHSRRAVPNDHQKKHRHQRSQFDVPIDVESSSGGSSRFLLCLMRIGFGLMMIMFIVLVLLTGVFYGLDLLVQGGCRTVHDNQPFLISFTTDQLIGTNNFIVDGSDVNTTVTNVINDCHDRVHFTRNLLRPYLVNLDRDVKIMMDKLNTQIFDQFKESIGNIDIPEDLGLLTQFVNQANLSNIPAKVKEINTDLNTIDKLFKKISVLDSTLPIDLVNQTIDEFKTYLTKVLESTIDACPLPLATIYKTDSLVCHKLGGSVNGLWLSVFFFLFFVIVGLCIFGVCIYKRLS